MSASQSNCGAQDLEFNRSRLAEVVITLISPQTESAVPQGMLVESVISRWHWFFVLLCLIALEVICFGPIVRNVGFYLDDWATICVLKMLNGDLWQRFTGLLVVDPRITPRPVEALFFVVTYMMFGMKPLGYHIFNGVLEVMAAFFWYLALVQLTQRRAIAFVAAAVFLLFPTHDATHYWATCDAETFSTAFALLSIWLTSLAAASKKRIYSGLSILSFNMAIFCYETLLPLVSLNVIFAGLIFLRKESFSKALKMALLVSVPFVLSVAALLVYSRLIAPQIGHPQVHAVQLNPVMMGTALLEGFKVNFPPLAVPFFAAQISQFCQRSGVNACILAFSLTALAGAAGCCLSRGSEIEKGGDKPLALLLLGLYTVFVSYTIFGLNPDYVPTLLTIVNRVNMGAAVGMSMIIAAVVAWLVQGSVKLIRRPRFDSFVLSLLVAPLLGFLVLSNRGLAIPWMVSWELQKTIFESLKHQGGSIKNGDSVILANCPRYVMWAPLFDGVWDFQAMLRLAVEKEVKGGVVSERLVMSGTDLKDISRGVLCGQYDFQGMNLLVAPDCKLIPITSPEHFIEQVKEKGFGFGLSRSVLEKWRSELGQAQ